MAEAGSKFERVCAAYWNSGSGPWKWDEMSEDEFKAEIRRGMAAALREMREPSTAQICAASDTYAKLGVTSDCTSWQAMIDELLREARET